MVPSKTPGINRGEQNQAEQSDRLVEGENPELFAENRVSDKDLLPGQMASPVPSEQNDRQSPSGETGAVNVPDGNKYPMPPSVSTSGGANRSGSSDRMGTFQLSSYQWEYAPYMNEWIRKIRRNWFEPISYLAGQGRGGRVLVTVSVSPEGKLLGIRHDFTNVNKEMTESALNAVLRSFTLPPLPEDFPDSVLTATFNMIYPVF